MRRAGGARTRLLLACLGLLACSDGGGAPAGDAPGAAGDAADPPPGPHFERLDADGSGRIERDEIPPVARRFMDLADADRDGELTAEEFAQFRDDPGGARRVELPANVELRADLPYADTPNPRQQLDLLLPRLRSGEGTLPVVAYVHGGGWNMGSRLMGHPELAELVATGRFAGASVGYRLSGEATWPAQIHDLKAALRWLRAHAERYGFDPDRIGVMGASAGGHLAAMLGTTSRGVPELEGTLGAHLGRRSDVRCVVDFFGPSDLTRPAPPTRRTALGDGPTSRHLLLGALPQAVPERARSASPLLFVSPDDPPFLIVHGTRDRLVPFSESEQLADALAQAGVDAHLQVIEGGGHGDFMSPEIRRRTTLFFDRCLHGRDVAVPTDPLVHRADLAGGSDGADAARPAELFAERISPANAARRRVGGTDAIGGIGDWALGNGTLCAVVSDRGHETAVAARGGALVDLAHCGRDDDQFVLAQPNLGSGRGGTRVDRVRAAVEAGEARVVVEGAADGLRIETRYALDAARPDALRIRTRVARVAPGAPAEVLSETLLHPSASLGAFALHTGEPRHSTGFARPSPEAAAGTPPPDLQVLVGGEGIEPGIAYGVRIVSAHLARADGEGRALPHFASGASDYSALGVAIPELGVGDEVTLERVIIVGRRADVASVTDRVFAAGSLVSGHVDAAEAADAADARLHLERSDSGGGVPVSQLRPDPDGRFRLRLPPGAYRLRALAPGGREAVRDFNLAEAALDLGEIALGPAARLRLPRGLGPVRLVFRGAGGTPDPELGSDLLGRRVGGERFEAGAFGNELSLSGGADDPRQVAVAPGRYRVFATRGPEYDLPHAELSIGPGQVRELEIAAPERAVATPGWIAADLHVHSALSFDSSLPLRERLVGFAAQGGEVLVATEHDRVVDLGPPIRALGLAGQIASVVGVELTGSVRSPAAPATIGHSNVFPLPHRPLRYRGGAPRGEGLRLREAIAEVRALGGRRVFQLNHPRRPAGESDDGSFFSHLSVGRPFDPTIPVDQGGNAVLVEVDPAGGLRDLDFDALELMNGPSLDYYRRVRADWLSLLLQGERRTATANSDSHRTGELVALPRTYVRVADDRVEGFDEAALVRALLAGRAFGTTGPLLEVRLGEADLGDTFRGREGVLHVSVDAAPWVRLRRARVYVDGELVAEGPVGSDEPFELPLTFEADGFVTVEVEGEAGDDYRAVAPGFTPFAFTNPIFVDADADGSWSAPGLPEALPAAIADPMATPPQPAR